MKQETTYEVNEKRILTALGEIDDQYIEEAETGRTDKNWFRISFSAISSAMPATGSKAGVKAGMHSFSSSSASAVLPMPRFSA